MRPSEATPMAAQTYTITRSIGAFSAVFKDGICFQKILPALKLCPLTRADAHRLGRPYQRVAVGFEPFVSKR